MHDSSSNTDEYHSCESKQNETSSQNLYYLDIEENDFKNSEDLDATYLKSLIEEKDEEILKYLNTNIFLSLDILKLQKENSRLIKEKNINEVEKELDLAKYELFELKK